MYSKNLLFTAFFTAYPTVKAPGDAVELTQIHNI